MMTKKFALYAGVAAIALAAGVTTLAIQANKPSEASTSVAIADASGRAITIYKSSTCSCCQSWVEHLDTNGFKPTVVDTDNLNEIKQQYGVPREMASCHTALIGDVVIEGHVPADDIVAYLENPQPDTVGLSVPGMVQGSPGMETGKKENYQVIAFGANGHQSVFREHRDY